MKNDNKKITNYLEYEFNPFEKGLGKQISLKRSSSSFKDLKAIVNDSKTGEEIMDNLQLSTRVYKDNATFNKVYDEKEYHIKSLSLTARAFIWHIVFNTDYDNRVYLNYMKDYEKMGYSSMHRPLAAIKELLERGILAKTTEQYVFWVNPEYFTRSNRLHLFKKYIQRECKKSLNLDALYKSQNKRIFNNFKYDTDVFLKYKDRENNN